MRRYLINTVFAACAFAVIPTASAMAAGPACSFIAAPPGTLSIVYTDATPAAAKVSIQIVGATIEVRDANNTLLACSAQPQPLVANVGQIIATDNVAAHDSIFSVNERNGAFLGGGTHGDLTGAQEIEIQYMAADGTDQLQVDGTDNADNWLLGESAGGIVGSNLNGDDDGDDITGAGVEKADFNGGKGDDQVSAVGNPAVPAIANPLTLDELILDGGNQNDTIRGGAGDDKLLGGTQDDELDGGGGNDSMDGGDDGDILDGGAGADSFTGGAGTDFATYADQANSVNVSIDGAPNDGGPGDGFADNVGLDVENVKGGSGNDFITGSALPNELTGNAGNDTLDGNLGNDKIAGSAGNDRLLGNIGNDKIFGGDGRDNMVGAAGNDKLKGQKGKDIFLGKKGIDRLIAKDGARDKKINCGPGNNKRESVTRDKKDPKPKSC